jgi:hypothetical protein
MNGFAPSNSGANDTFLINDPDEVIKCSNNFTSGLMIKLSGCAPAAPGLIKGPSR